MLTWIDLTRTIQNEMVTWPGDPKPEILPANRIRKGDSCNTSFLRLNSHLGTHLDAPFHFEEEGKRLHQMPLEPLVGRAVLIDRSEQTTVITRKDLESEELSGFSRVLIKTSYGERMEDTDFHEDFVGLDGEAAAYLVEQGVQLVGIDYLSIEPFHQDGHETHHTLLGNEVVIVEGLDLSQLEPGSYDLICLPLKIKDCDGSPCRAIAKRITGEN